MIFCRRSSLNGVHDGYQERMLGVGMFFDCETVWHP